MTEEEIKQLKAEIFDILRKQEELQMAINALNTTKTEKLKRLQELEAKQNV